MVFVQLIQPLAEFGLMRAVDFLRLAKYNGTK